VSDWQRLKALLLGEERTELDAHAQRLETLERDRERLAALEQGEQRLVAVERNQAHLPERLPAALERAQRGDDGERLSRALAGPVAQSLGTAVRSNRQVIVDALFPIIGPAIRKSIAEALRTLVADINRALESSFTPRGLRWRVESWRTGAPYAQVVLKHTLRFKLDHVFLIERDSGLVMHRESAPDLPDLDSDAIAGMLTAIGEFVKDSVGREAQGALESARVGEHVLWVIEGPRANLACFIRGVPPPALHAALTQRLEAIHARLNDPLSGLQAGAADLGAAWDRDLDLITLEREAREQGDAAAVEAKPSRLPFVLIALALLALLVAWWVRDWQWSQRMGEVRTLLRSWPGFVVQGVDSEPFESVRVRGLIDAHADSPERVLKEGLLRDYALTLETRGYVATDAAIVERRARALLQPPASAQVQFADGLLTLRGQAPADWVALARERAAWVAGVTRVDAAQLSTDLDAERTELDALRARLEQTDIRFETDTEFSASGAEALTERMLPDLARAQALATALGQRVHVRTYGLTDETGSDALNAALRRERAQALARFIAREQPGLMPEPIELASDDARATLRIRAARLLLDVQGPTP
jgi:outer membrane protein OmpA-like peptidoglycan-associated protein